MEAANSFTAQYPARMYPVNVSTSPLPAALHDSGVVWFATPSPHDFAGL